MGVDHGGLQAGVSEQRLNGADIVIGLEQVSGEGVAESVRSDTLEYFGLADCRIERLLQF